MGKRTAGNYRIRQDADHFKPGYWLLIIGDYQMGFCTPMRTLIKLKFIQSRFTLIVNRFPLWSQNTNIRNRKIAFNIRYRILPIKIFIYKPQTFVRSTIRIRYTYVAEAIFIGLILIIAAYFGPSILILVWIKYRKHFNHHEMLGPIVADGIL